MKYHNEIKTTQLTFADLDTIQHSLDSTISEELSNKGADYQRISEIALIASKVDTLRRKAWNDQKFGPYEAMAEEAVQTFAPDDIPF